MSGTSSLKELFKPTPVLRMLLQFQKSSIESEISSFKHYIFDNRSGIIKYQETFNNMIDKQVEESPDNSQEIHEFYEDQYYRYNEFYPATFNNSTLLLLYSFFEFTLKQLCKTLEKHKGYSIKLEDLSGQNYIEKSKRYLTLVAILDLTDLNSTWEKITQFQQLRNCIVHNNSNIKKNKNQPITNQPLYQIIHANNNLKLNEVTGTFIISNDQFLLDFADTILHYLISAIRKLEAD